MSERIRYKALHESIKESIQPINHPTNGAVYKAQVNTDTWEWTIIETGSGLTAASGKNIDRHKTQLEVRAALKALGILLNTESRAKRTK